MKNNSAHSQHISLHASQIGTNRHENEIELNELNSKQTGPMLCHCGKQMERSSKYERSDDAIECHGCQYILPDIAAVFYCECTSEKREEETRYDYFCDSCAEHIGKCNKAEIADQHNSAHLYFLFNKNEVTGPHLVHEIITLFVTKKLKEDKIYVMAARGGSWCKLVFPQHILNERDYDDPKRKLVMTECDEINKDFKARHPELYNSLIENPFTGKMKQIEEPDDFPEEEQTKNVFQSRLIRRILGKMIAFSLTIIILLHCIPTMILAFLMWCFYSITHNCKFRGWGVIFSIVFVLYSGMAIAPFINVYFMMSEMHYWDEIQSWMISYIIWGIVSLMTSISHFVLIYFHKDIRILDNAILLIMGVDFGDFDVVRELEGNNFFEMLGIIFIFPALASLLPASVIGFIANYYLEEKFDLKCDEDIARTSQHLCLEEEYGCCEVISSHDIYNTWSFFGGLASNMLFTWAIIRIGGYLLVQGFPKLALFVKRGK